YNSLEQITAVVTIQRDIHKVAVAELRDIISSGVIAHLSTWNGSHKQCTTLWIVGLSPLGFDSDYAKCRSKKPDGLFKY
ncbi:hypothetical protein V1506DRAFT_442965, partial [Lipomyces tetrasporus]